MEEELLYSVDMLLILGVSVILFLLLTEVGFLLGRRSRSSIDEDARSQINTVQGAILGLLALLLGFTFAMALSRFDARKQLILEESNAIGTTFLRAQLMLEPQRTEVSNLLRRYVAVRLKFYEAGIEQDKLKAANDETGQLQKELWSQATAWGKKDPRDLTMGLFLQSLNEVIDLHAERLNANENHVPEIVLVLLYFVAFVAIGIIGYGCGLGGVRNFFVTMTASILIAAVIIVIIDLDRPQQGLIIVSQQRMIELRRDLEKMRF
jgi:hypothetical protein